MSVREISIRDIGPIEHLRLPIPEEGGVVVLRGRNGLGKSTALRAIDTAVSGRGRIEHRDGAVAGVVEACGITVKAMRNQTRTGELEVASLEGRFSIADLVDPKLKEPGAADAKRIKALVQLTGQRADPSLFYELVGGQRIFQELVSLKAIEAEDLVQMAGQVKRDLETKARDLKEEAAKVNISAETSRRAAEGINTTLSDDAQKLADDHRIAVAELERLKAVRNAAIVAESKLATARESLSSVERNYSGATVKQAHDQADDCKRACDETAAVLARAEEAVRIAREEHARNQLKLQNAIETLKTAEAHETAMAQWRADLGIIVPENTVSDEDIANAEADVAAALEAIETGIKVREAKKRLKEAADFDQKAADLRTKSDALYAAAQGTDTVLSEVVQRLGCPLRVSHGRLVTTTDRSESELFAELSRGEQWKIALDIAIEAVGRNGVLVVDQEGWEGIDPVNQRLIHNHLVGTGVVLFTAQCDVGELRVA
jgi:energy-coupling factor transporter ATP-binding protein EcfA2